MKEPININVNCECCGREMVKGLDVVSKANVCIKCRDVFAKISRAEAEQGYGLNEKCPKNVNSYCEVVPKAIKYIRVKAWANMDEDSGCDIITAVNILPKHFSGAYNVPCTILIDEKYLRPAKGKGE